MPYSPTGSTTNITAESHIHCFPKKAEETLLSIISTVAAIHTAARCLRAMPNIYKPYLLKGKGKQTNVGSGLLAMP